MSAKPFRLAPIKLNPVLGMGIGLLLLCIPLFFWQLDGYTLFNITEAKQAEIARQLWVRQDWITPVYNGEVYFDKPVLLHWLIAIGYRLFGMNEWAVRLPSAIAATALILGTGSFVSQVATRRTALLAATMLAANPFTFAIGRTGQHDMLLTLFMSAALYCWFLAYSKGWQWSHLSFFALLGFAILSKGPLALVLCSLIIAIFLTWTGQWRSHLAKVPWRKGALIFGGITLPWYLLMLLSNGWTFIQQFFLFNNVDRFVTANLNQVGPWYYYLPLLLLGFFPWIVPLLPAAIQIPWRSHLRLSYWRQQPPDRHLGLFMSIWLLTVLGFMSIAATKLPWYIHPGFSALAYLCADAWERQIALPDRWLKLSLRVVGLADVGLAIAFLLAPRLISNSAVQQVAATGAFWQLSLIHLAAAVAIWFSVLQRKALWAWGSSLIAFGLMALTLVNQVLPVLDHTVLGGRLLPIASALQQEICENCQTDLPAAFGVNDPSLNFYSRLSYIKRFEFPDELEFQLQQPQRLLLVTKDSVMQRLGLNLDCYTPAHATEDFKLFIIPPNEEFDLDRCNVAKGNELPQGSAP
jgi:4-amino-4-deoxy-L-arabinose transferase-like glycosyltransferase